MEAEHARRHGFLNDHGLSRWLESVISLLEDHTVDIKMLDTLTQTVTAIGDSEARTRLYQLIEVLVQRQSS
jgi:hypothetical protein